ncbi:uncharacterized protein LOC111074762 [Drosophila obscura]|uniref:uncharacterized protein LOC111074762 n=1 Tax=Drosophila obscura TaxID=7282 RepID=UPI001BB12C8D|nr:uncharacterized protein LOC111074762 [Drosophila obscura]
MYRKLICLSRWLPKHIDTIPDQIWNLLLARFYTANLLCVFFDLILLFYSCSLSYLLDVPVGTFAFTSLLIMLQPGVALYGLLLCHIHNEHPISYRTRLQRLRQEMPLRIQLLVTVLYVSILTSRLYACFMDIFDVDWPPYFLLIHGCCCGFAYFLAEHGRRLRRFSLPGLGVGLCIWRSIVESTFQSHKVRLVVVTALASGLIQSSCWILVLDGDLGQGWSAEKMFWAWILTTLVLAKLHVIKNIYEVVMQQELPLVLNPRQVHLRYNKRLWEHFILWMCRQQLCQVPEDLAELQLSFYMALDIKCLYGFRLLAASEFHEAASNHCDRLCPTIFSPIRLHTSWLNLRELIMAMVDEFVANMKSAMEDSTPPYQPLQRPQKNQIRNATKPSTTLPVQTTPKCLSACDQLIARNLKFPSLMTDATSCQPIIKSCPTWDGLKAAIEGIALKFQRFFIWSRGIWECLPRLPAWVHYFCDTNPMEKINHALRRAEHLDDVLRGLVRIFIRSLKEDEYGSMESDLVRFVKALLQVEKQLYAALDLKMCRSGRLCGTHEKLLVGIEHCMFCMLQHFSSNLDFMVHDKVLLKTLKCKMKSLGIPHTPVR